MRQEFLKRLRSRNRMDRMRAWRELCFETEASHYVLQAADRRELAEILAEEDDDGVHRLAADILMGFSCCAGSDHQASVHPPQTSPREHSLDDWLWSDFRNQAAVFRATERGYSRRDADAVEILARRLPFKDYPLVNFQPLPLHEDGWRQITTEQAYQTICVVGRLSLFGDRAITELANREARFRFLRQSPPPHHESGPALREYYCLQEFDGERLVNQYHMEDVDGMRTDFGIVQRYPLFLGTRMITVVLCAGASSLGTVGAAQWAARDMGPPQDTASSVPITLPKGIVPRSRLEALICTTSVSGAAIWRPSKIQLLALYVDHYRWSLDDLQWHDTKRHEVEIRLQGGKPVSLSIDGERARLNAGSQNFRLATKVALQARQHRNGGVDVKQLALDRDIWDDRELRPSKVKQRLHHLNRQVLKGTLIIDHQVRLDAHVTVVND